VRDPGYWHKLQVEQRLRIGHSLLQPELSIIVHSGVLRRRIGAC